MNATYTLVSPNLAADVALPFLARGVQLSNASNQWLYLPSAAVNVAPYTAQVVSLPGDTVGRVRQQPPAGRIQANPNAGEVVTLIYDSAALASSAATPLTGSTAVANSRWVNTVYSLAWPIAGQPYALNISLATNVATSIRRAILTMRSANIPAIDVALCLHYILVGGYPFATFPFVEVVMSAGVPYVLELGNALPYATNMYAIVNFAEPSRPNVRGVVDDTTLVVNLLVDAVTTS